VGWSMASHMPDKLFTNALTMAIWKRKPAKGLLWHTDRGSQMPLTVIVNYSNSSGVHVIIHAVLHTQPHANPACSGHPW